MTGYRVFSRMFVKTMPVLSSGFEVETEMTLHALDKGLRIEEIPIDYLQRPVGSESKLNTLRDGPFGAPNHRFYREILQAVDFFRRT